MKFTVSAKLTTICLAMAILTMVVADTTTESKATEPKTVIANPQVSTEAIEQDVEAASFEGLEFSEDEKYLLAKIAMAEAESEDTEGKALVMLVVINRVNSSSFPDSIEEVIYQENQFTPASNGRLDRVEPDEDCYLALDIVLSGWDESKGALYFENGDNSSWHKNNLEYLFSHGNHNFYTEKEG